MAEMRGMSMLQSEIDKAKDKLKDVNENIKKLTGRDPTDLRSARGRLGDSRGRGRLFNLARRGIMPEESGGGPQPPGKRRNMRGAFSRLGPMPTRRREREDSGDEDEPPAKMSVQSSVVATSRDARSRQDTMAQQSKDREGLQRNRRMFGLLLGTLQKFKTESKVLDQKAEQRKQIEKKLEEDAEREKKRYHQETQQLIEESQLEQAKITRLQHKMELVNEHDIMTNEMKKLHNFICTRTKPRLFWKPKAMNSAADGRLKESRKTVDKMIREKDLALEREIKEVMEREYEREDRIRSRLHPDKENTGSTSQPDEDAVSHKDNNKDGGRRRSHDKKDGHRHSGLKEAKKKQHEMQYDDGEEEDMEEEEGGTSNIDLGDHATGGGGGGGKTGGDDGKGKGGLGEEGEIKQEKVSPAKTDKAAAQESLDDGNNTDVDYEDDEHSEAGREDEEEEETVTNTDALSAIPMPQEPQGGGESPSREDSHRPMGPVEPSIMVVRQQEEREVATVRLTQVGGGGVVDEMDEQEQELLEARRRRAIMAEDGEDMEDEPADE